MRPNRPARRLTIVAATIALTAGSLAGTSLPAAAQVGPDGVDAVEKVLSHFLCYGGRMGGFANVVHPPVITVDDRFTSDFGATVSKGTRFCNPVQKKKGKRVLAPIRHGRQHLKWYQLAFEGFSFEVEARIDNQFGLDQPMTFWDTPNVIAVPTRKHPHRFPNGLDHFGCRGVISGESVDRRYKLTDQFRRYRRVRVSRPTWLCLSIIKEHDGKRFVPNQPEANLVCYRVDERKVRFRRKASNQFEKRRGFTAKRTKLLCVPSLVRLGD